MTERMVHESERVVLRQRHKPERHLGEIHGHIVTVHPVEAALGHKSPCEDDFVLVRWDVRPTAVRTPRLDKAVAKVTAGLDQERARPHRWIADLEVENRLRPRRRAV